ncbi:MAG: hypothetical protein EBQ73_11715 [Gammaproteobacteria bacterium]|nr:hypothetical protein [Gammaproteobacteria bacterium]
MAEVLVHRGDPRRILPPTMSGMAEVKKSMCQRFVAKVRPILKRPSRTTRVGTDTMTFLVGCGLYSQELSEKEIKALAEYYGQQRVMRRKPIALSECHAGIVGCFGEWLDGDQFPKHDQNVPDLGIGHL